MMSSEEGLREGLRRARSLKGWSQEELAEQIDVAPKTVSRWENGTAVPTSRHRERLCRVLGMTPEELELVRPPTDLSLPLSSPLVLLASSFTDAEKAIISHLRTTLQERGFTVWSSRQLSRYIEEYPQKALSEAFRTLQGIVVIISPEVRSSHHIRDALSLARTHHRPVCGVWIAGQSWQACLPRGVGELPAPIDARTRNDPDLFEEIAAALHQTGLAPEVSRSPRAATLEQQNRQRMLQRLHRSYDELMRQSLEEAAWLELGLAEQPAAVHTLAAVLSRASHQAEQPLAFDTSILQIYDEAASALLILGEPGTGKSTLLLHLAQQFVKRAEADETHPLPVIIPLSSWAVKRPALEVWLGEQLNQLYDVPHRLSEQWVREERIFPLLDGLDEMEAAAHSACIATINAYHHEHLLVPLVVCLRKAEYEAAAAQQRLTLQRAVAVQPLTPGQVENALLQAGQPLAALHEVIQKNPALGDLARTPLMLSVLMRTYQGTAMHELPTKETVLQQRVWNDYLKRMVERKGNTVCYPLDLTARYLSWLARQMRAHNQTIFYLEHLQPDWLPAGERHRYEHVAVRGLGILVGILVSLFVTALFFTPGSLTHGVWFGLMGGLIGGLISGGETTDFRLQGMMQVCQQRWRSLGLLGAGNGVLVGGLVALAFWSAPSDGLIYGSSAGLCGLLLTIIIASGKVVAPQSALSLLQRHRLFPQGFQPGHLHVGVIVGVIVGLLFGLSQAFSGGLSDGLSDELSFGIIGASLSLLLLGRKSDIELAEIVVWSAKRLRESFTKKQYRRTSTRLFLPIFLLFGLSGVLSGGPIYGLIYGLSQALSLSMAYWVYRCLWGAVSRETLDDHDRTRPNEGIKRSVRNAPLVGLVAGGMCFLLGLLNTTLYYEFISRLSGGLSQVFSFGLRDGLLIGCAGAVFAASLMGGLASVRHSLLRLHLQRLGVLPQHPVHFLDDAARRILLYKDGGGYRFIHRLLLDYFAERER